jgi:predicted O-methyltransferase YrrM
MLSVASAIETQKVDKINLWCTVEPKGKFYDAIKNKVNTIKIDNINRKAIEKDETFKKVHMKDAIQWNILYEHGGMSLDLDVICTKDMSNLIAFTDVIASLDIKNENSIAFPFNNAIVIVAGKHNEMINQILQYTNGKMQLSINWGDTGPIILSTAMKMMKRASLSAMYAPHEVLNPWGGREIGIVYEENENTQLPTETRAIHLYAKASGKKFDDINSTWVKNSKSLLARTIRNIIPKNIWEIEENLNVEKYLNARGKHYKRLFDVIGENDIKHILEIGTSSGETAIAMIKKAGETKNEEDIHYYGIDLFENATDEQLEEEFSGNYGKNKLEDVKTKLETRTKAHIHLNETNLPKMDIIYIDGGHSIKTIDEDWKMAQKLMHINTVVVLDDYFSEMGFIGAKQTVNNIKKNITYDVEISTEIDDYKHNFGRLRTQLAIVKIHNEMEKKEQPKTKPEYKNEWAKDIMGRIKK